MTCIHSPMTGRLNLFNMFKVGDKITLGDKVGKITAVHTDSRIGFHCEGRRSHTYDIEFLNIPEKDIDFAGDGRTERTETYREGNELPSDKKEEPS